MTSYCFKWSQKLLALVMGLFFAQTLQGQIESIQATPSCGSTCNGKLTVRIKADVAVPLHLTLIDGGTKLQEKNGVRTRTVEFFNVCPGQYTLFVKPEVGVACAQKDERGIIPSVDLQAVLKEIKHPTTASSGDGKISVGVNSSENVNYRWSNGSSESTIDNLNPGSYTVTITSPSVGCSVSATYTLKNCTDDPNNNGYDLRVIGGVMDNEVNGTTRIELHYVPFLGTETQLLGNEHAVVWKNAQTGAVLGHGYRLDLANNLGVKEVRAEMNDGCKTYTITKQILSCSASAKELASRFISHLGPACYGTDDGYAILEFSSTKGDEIQLDLLWDENRETFFRLSGAIGLERNNGNWIARADNLIAGKTYIVDGFLGYNCPINFSFTVPIKPSQKVFSTYDQTGHYCEFTEICDGQQIGPPGNYREVPNFDLSKLENCTIDEVICGDKVIPLRRDRHKISGWQTMPAPKALELIENLPLASLTPLYEQIKHLHPCTHVRMCRLDPFGYNLEIHNIAEIKIGPTILTPDGCQQYKCLSLTLIGGIQTHKVCVKDWEIPNSNDFGDNGVRINVVPPPEPVRGKCETPQKYNLMQMVLWHRSGALDQAFGSRYKNSMLEAQLKQINVTSQSIRCGTIEFCVQDLNRDVKVNLGSGCGSLLTNTATDRATKCGIKEIVRLNTATGSTYSENYLNFSPIQMETKFLEALNDNSIQTLKFFCGSTVKQLEYAGTTKPNFKPQVFTHEEEQLASFREEEDSVTHEPIIIPVMDTLPSELLMDFSYVKYLGGVIPKGIVQAGGQNLYWEYAYDPSPILKTSLPYVTKSYKDWDANRSIISAQLIPDKQFAIIYEDSTTILEKFLTSEQYLSIRHVSVGDSLATIAGIVKGDFRLDNAPVANTNDLSIFVYSVDTSGLLHSFTLLENIDTTQGIYFSENRNGTLALATGFKSNQLRLNGQAYDPGIPEGLLLCTWTNGQFSPLKVIQANAANHWQGLSLNAAADQVNIALRGVDSLRSSGTQWLSNAGNKVALAALSTQGTLKWQYAIADSTLQADKMGMVSDDAQGLLFALSYRDSLTLSDRGFRSAGQQDILLGKLDAQGTLAWARSFGTVDQENVSQVSYSSGLFFYGGQFSGATKLRPLGEVWYDNRTPYNDRVYISFVIDSTYVPDTTVQVPNTTALLIPEDKVQNTVPLARNTNVLENPEVLVYPNPFRNEVTIEFMLNQSAHYTLRLVDNLGGTLKVIPFAAQVGYNAQTLQTQYLPAGMYFLQLTDGAGRLVKTQRIVKL